MHVQYVQSYSYTVQLRVAVVGLANCFCCKLQVVILLKHLVIAVALSLLCKLINAVMEKFHAVGDDHLTSLPQIFYKHHIFKKIVHVGRVVTQS